jgi:hypothetical protein
MKSVLILCAVLALGASLPVSAQSFQDAERRAKSEHGSASFVLIDADSRRAIYAGSVHPLSATRREVGVLVAGPEFEVNSRAGFWMAEAYVILDCNSGKAIPVLTAATDREKRWYASQPALSKAIWQRISPDLTPSITEKLCAVDSGLTKGVLTSDAVPMPRGLDLDITVEELKDRYLANCDPVITKGTFRNRSRYTGDALSCDIADQVDSATEIQLAGQRPSRVSVTFCDGRLATMDMAFADLGGLLAALATRLPPTSFFLRNGTVGATWKDGRGVLVSASLMFRDVTWLRQVCWKSEQSKK